MFAKLDLKWVYQQRTMRYFIPEWDDRVDPNYDFTIDGITPDRDPYNHDVYAHEIYSTPNYDGVLVSKSVIEENKTKKARIESIGIHKHVRVPRDFPVFGDCGAFNYIDQEVPPFETEETVNFYQNLDFDYGVSIDHLIVPGLLKREVYALVDSDGNEQPISADLIPAYKADGYTIKKRPRTRDMFAEDKLIYTWEEECLEEAKRRWKLTLDNAKDFIETHKKLGAKFVPIAGCQGWDSESQAEMFKAQQAMGYEYIALGGLVRSKTEEIVAALESVNKIRNPSTKIHLFGVARPEAIPQFVEQRVDSVDSARFLRQAWLSATSNYYAGDPEAYAQALGNGTDLGAASRYTAMRIPPVLREGGNTPTAKAKKLLESGQQLENLKRQEQEVLDTVHAFDRGEVSLEDTLKTVVEYDVLTGGDPGNEDLYRKTLEDRPWEKCPCAVCQKIGVDVLIFRRNNRNRRRGFHNTWWFYKMFKRLTSQLNFLA